MSYKMGVLRSNTGKGLKTLSKCNPDKMMYFTIITIINPMEIKDKLLDAVNSYKFLIECDTKR